MAPHSSANTSGRLIVAGACLLMTVTGVARAAPEPRTRSQAQSLAEIAAAEAKRRAQVTEPAWIFNDFNLPAAPERPAPEPSEPPEKTAPAPGGEQVAPVERPDEQPDAVPSAAGSGDKRTEAQWRQQATRLANRRAKLRRSADSLEQRRKELRRLTDGRREEDAPAAYRESRRVADALAKVQRDLASLDETWKRLEEDAARAQVPADWLAATR